MSTTTDILTLSSLYSVFLSCSLSRSLFPSSFSSSSFFCSQYYGGVAYVDNSGSLTLRDSTTTNNTVNGELSAFYIASNALSLNIINPHPSSQTDVIRGDPSKLATCTPTPPCKPSEACVSAAPSLGVICFDIPFVNTVSCGGLSTAARQVQGCSTIAGTLTITLIGFNLNDFTSVAVGAEACAVTSSSATSINCTVATATVWGSDEVSLFFLATFWIF